MNNPAILVDHVTKQFGSEVVLKDVSLTLEAGKIHGIIGRNGSGKTILLASHFAQDIDELCDTVCEMDQGILR